jgi:hypothetical protein
MTRIGTLLVYGCVAAGVVHAQATGTISGMVITKAGAGAPVQRAQVRVKHSPTGTPYSTQTSANGSYTISGLPPGTYEISVQLPPFFIPFERKDVRVQAGQTARIDVSLDDVTLGTLGDGGEQFAALNAEHLAPSGPAPRTHDGKPDLSGVWLPSTPSLLGDPPEPLPWAEATARRRKDDLGKDAPQSHCLPMGPAWGGFFWPFRLVQSSDLLVIIDENADPPRRIYLDGRAHPTELNPTFMGHSVGRWEEDTLVVDSVGFNDRAWLTLQSYPLDDPGAFRKPWKMKRVSSLAPKSADVMEYVCTENNRDVPHMVGK